LESLEVLERIAGKIAPGRMPSYNQVQVFKAMEIIGASGAMGRIRLSKELELGEATIRSLLRHAKKEGIFESSRRGITLSEYGKKLLSDLRFRISEGIAVPNNPLAVGPFNMAVLVRGAAPRVRRGLEQRDTAVRAGALGATTLVFFHNKLCMPFSEEDIFKDIPSIHKMLLSRLSPKENDVIIVGSGENEKIAELGAKMAALELLRTEN
jgi:predicted transcriptional regulator